MTRALPLLAVVPVLVCAAVVAPGCGTDKLETGYVYTPLGDSSIKRRGYYADPFSPEARAAQPEQRAARAEQVLWAGQYLGDVDRLRLDLLAPAGQVRAAQSRPWWRR